MWYKSYTGLRVHFDERKSRKLRKALVGESGLRKPRSCSGSPTVLTAGPMILSSIVRLVGSGEGSIR